MLPLVVIPARTCTLRLVIIAYTQKFVVYLTASPISLLTFAIVHRFWYSSPDVALLSLDLYVFII